MTYAARFSADRLYRYSLWRKWAIDDRNGHVMFIGLNPSTADETRDDPTIRRCIGFARKWGFGSLVMCNLFAYRETSPEKLKRELLPIGLGNDRALKICAASAALVVAAWGTHGSWKGRDAEVKRMIPNLYYLRLTKKRHPAHPLYLPETLVPIKWVFDKEIV